MHVFKSKKILIMIKKILLVGFLAIIFASCNDDSDVNNNSDTTILETAELTKINLSDFEVKAGDFVGKEVEISGIVDHVCKHGGKKLLLVEGDYNVHVYNDDRFDEALSGSKITVTGVVEEERVDSVYLAEKLKHEEESNSGDNEEDTEHLNMMREHVQIMMDSLKKEGVEYFSNFSLKFVSLEEEK